MNDSPEYLWHPIEPLGDTERSIDLAAIRPLYDSWRTAKARLKESSASNLTDFTDRLVRSLSIETGILERIYDLDRGTTEALITHGFAEDLISRARTDVEPGRLIDILRDQEAAIKLVMDGVAQSRALTTGFVHELHAILTRHQDSTTAIDPLGNRVEIPLLKGTFKQQPNNPTRPSGQVHEYAPPIHVAAEIDNLLEWLPTYSEDDPVIVAAWLHHRFTQIHPYQDGNGRVARVLTLLILLRSDLLPLVIDRDLHTEYVNALEAADRRNLGPLAHLFARLERGTILQALSIDADAEVAADRSLTTAVIDSLAAKFDKRKRKQLGELRQVNNLAVTLRARTRKYLESAFTALKEPVSQIAEPDVRIMDGGPDRNNAHWYKFEVIKSGESSQKFVNFSEGHYFIKATMRADTERLVFVTSLHHVGRELTGIMEATAFARLEAYEDPEDWTKTSQEFFSCSLEPFVITWRTSFEDIAQAFDRWLDRAVAVAIKEFGDRL